MALPEDFESSNAAPEADDFRDQATAAVEAWCEWVEGLTLRDDGSLCEVCAASGLLDALDDFSLLPHRPIHALLQVLGELLGAEVEGQVGGRLAVLHHEWQEELDPDGPDGPPDVDAYAGLRRWYEFERATIASAGETLHDLLTLEMREVIARVASDRVLIALALATDWMAASVDAAGAQPDRLGLVPASLRQEVADTVDTRVRQWMVWLPRGAWRRSTAVPDGERCEVCSGNWPLDIDAPHGALHPLRRRLVGVLDGALAAPIISPTQERDPVARRAELQQIIDHEVLARGAFIRRALEVYVLLEVEEDVRASALHLLTTQPDDDGCAAGPLQQA